MGKILALITKGVLMLSLSTGLAEVQANVTDKHILRVKLNTQGITPFSSKASVDALYASIAPVLGQLVYTSNSYDLEPGLLQSFKWDYKTKSFLLKLKKGLTFHNGRAATAKDLEFSLLRGFYSSRPSFFTAFLNNIEGIEAIKGQKNFQTGQVSGVQFVDELTLRVKLLRPNPSFLHSLARSYFSLVPIEELKADYETWKTYPIGAGEYKVKSLNQSDKMMTLESTSDSSKKLLLYFGDKSFNVDIEVGSTTVDKEITTSKRAGSLTSIFFNFNNEIAKDINFRKAINIALNRKELTKDVKIYDPSYEFLAKHFWGRANKETKVDIQQASKLFKKVKSLDLSKVYEVPVFVSSLKDQKYTGYMSEIEKQLAAAGLKVKLVASSEKFLNKDNKTTLFRVASLGADVADPLVLFGLFQGEKSPMRPHFPIKDKGYSDLFKKAQTSTSFDQRVITVKALSNYIFDNTWMVPLFERKQLVSINPKRVKTVGTQDGGLTFFLDRVSLQ
jgi:ABC-type transport system substrate-binding protein